MQSAFWRPSEKLASKKCSLLWKQAECDRLREESIYHFSRTLSNLINIPCASEQEESGITEKILGLVRFHISEMMKDTKITPQDRTLIIRSAIKEAINKHKPVLIFGLHTTALSSGIPIGNIKKPFPINSKNKKHF